MQDHRVFKGYKGFAVILDQKAIPVVKDLREISDRRDQQDQQVQSVQRDRREILDRRDQEAFRGQQDQWDQLVPWVHKA